MNFCFVSTLRIDSIIVTCYFMAIQRGLEFEKSILLVENTTSFQIARFSTIFCVSSCIIYEKIPFSKHAIGHKPHVDILKNAPLRAF